MCTYACAGQRSPRVLLLRYIPPSTLRLCLSLSWKLPKMLYWPESPGHPACLSARYWDQMHTTTLNYFTWVLGNKPRYLCLSGTHLSEWAISPALRHSYQSLSRRFRSPGQFCSHCHWTYHLTLELYFLTSFASLTHKRNLYLCPPITLLWSSWLLLQICSAMSVL